MICGTAPQRATSLAVHHRPHVSIRSVMDALERRYGMTFGADRCVYHPFDWQRWSWHADAGAGLREYDQRRVDVRVGTEKAYYRGLTISVRDPLPGDREHWEARGWSAYISPGEARVLTLHPQGEGYPIRSVYVLPDGALVLRSKIVGGAAR